MSGRNTFIRTANTVSLATWFGGSLMGVVGLPRASTGSSTEAPTVTEPAARATDGAAHAGQLRAEGRAWAAWQPVQAAAIATQLASGAALTVANRHRVAGQRGVATTSVVRTALTGAAIGATVLAARSGRQLEHRADDADGVDGAAALERRTRAYQMAVPVLTGALLAVDSLMGEQQRPNQVLRGTVQRVLPDAVAERLAA